MPAWQSLPCQVPDDSRLRLPSPPKHVGPLRRLFLVGSIIIHSLFLALLIRAPHGRRGDPRRLGPHASHGIGHAAACRRRWPAGRRRRGWFSALANGEKSVGVRGASMRRLTACADAMAVLCRRGTRGGAPCLLHQGRRAGARHPPGGRAARLLALHASAAPCEHWARAACAHRSAARGRGRRRTAAGAARPRSPAVETVPPPPEVGREAAVAARPIGGTHLWAAAARRGPGLVAESAGRAPSAAAAAVVGARCACTAQATRAAASTSPAAVAAAIGEE